MGTKNHAFCNDDCAVCGGHLCVARICNAKRMWIKMHSLHERSGETLQMQRGHQLQMRPPNNILLPVWHGARWQEMQEKALRRSGAAISNCSGFGRPGRRFEHLRALFRSVRWRHLTSPCRAHRALRSEADTE